MTQDHALSHQKKSSCLENGTSSCFDLKSLPSSVKESLLPNSDPKVIEEQILNGTWFSSAGMHKFILKSMTSLLVTTLPNFMFWKNDIVCIDDSNCKWELAVWLQTKNCVNQSDDVTNVFWWRHLSHIWKRVFDQTKLFNALRISASSSFRGSKISSSPLPKTCNVFLYDAIILKK